MPRCQKIHGSRVHGVPDPLRYQLGNIYIYFIYYTAFLQYYRSIRVDVGGWNHGALIQ